MRAWERDKAWSDQFVPEIKSILGRHLISDAPVEDDQERNTDLMVMTLGAIRVGCRVRRPENFREDWRDEFTVRAGRPNGMKTELAKIVEGWGDYCFYALGNNDGTLKFWGIGNLAVFRYWFTAYLSTHGGDLPGQLIRNHDGSSDFRVFRWQELPDEFTVARS